MQIISKALGVIASISSSVIVDAIACLKPSKFKDPALLSPASIVATTKSRLGAINRDEPANYSAYFDKKGTLTPFRYSIVSSKKEMRLPSSKLASACSDIVYIIINNK